MSQILSRRFAVGAALAVAGAAMPIRSAKASGVNKIISAAAYGVTADGVTDDSGALAAAVAAMSNGSVLVLPAGTIALGSTGWAGISIVGLSDFRVQGNATSIKWLSKPSQLVGPSWPTGMKLKNCMRAIVSDLLINGNSVDCSGFGLEACQDCLVIDVQAFAHGNASIASGGSQLVSVGGVRNSWRSCVARDSTPGSAYRGLGLGNANSGFGEMDLLVEDCKARNNDATGIAMQSVRARIVNNYSEGNKGAGIISATAAGNDSFDQVIVGNICRSNTFHGYQLDVFGNNAARITVAGNVFSQNTNSGIYCNRGTHIVIDGNVIEGNLGSGIAIVNSTGVTVSDNIIDADSSAGICITTAFPANVVSDLNITGNHCTGASSHTIWLGAVDSASSLSTVLVSANIVRGGDYGILVTTGVTGAQISDITVASNVVEGTSLLGYWFENHTGGGPINNLRVFGNGGNSGRYTNVLASVDTQNSSSGTFSRSSAVPTTGTWSQGDLIWNSLPSAGGAIGWVCVVAGTPGTWKPFGSISP